MKTNYHTHTKRCNYAIGTDREYVEAAIQAGIKKLGFSDHVPVRTGLYEIDWFRIAPENTAEYFESIRSLKEEYKNDIEILIGFEAEYFPSLFNNMIDLLSDNGCDYIILGQHFLEIKPGEEYVDPRNEYKGANTIDHYVKTLIEGMETGLYSAVAHPDALHKNYDPDLLKDAYRKICEAAKRHSLPVEFNRLGLSTGRDYPDVTFFEIAAEVGNDVVIGYDAHSPADLLDDEGYELCRSTIKELGINLLEDVKLIKPVI